MFLKIVQNILSVQPLRIIQSFISSNRMDLFINYNEIKCALKLSLLAHSFCFIVHFAYTLNGRAQLISTHWTNGFSQLQWYEKLNWIALETQLRRKSRNVHCSFNPTIVVAFIRLSSSSFHFWRNKQNAMMVAQLKTEKRDFDDAKNSFMMEKKVARWIEWKFQFKSSQSEVKKRIKREKMSALSTDNKVSGDNVLWIIFKHETFLTFEFKNFAELWFSLLTKKFLCNSRF